MPFARREFLHILKSAGITAAATQALGSVDRPVKAVAFDAFPILDARPIASLAEELFPGRGTELNNLWRTRQFEYMWLRSLARRYRDFLGVTQDALLYAAEALKLDLPPDRRVLLLDAWLKLKCWPDVPAALGALKENGLKIAFLSNMTTAMLQAGIRNSGLDGLFDHVLSTDRVQVYKPDPRAYQMGVDAFHLHPREIVFAAFAGWDAAGAASFGYRTFWVNRQNQPAEQLGAPSDAAGTTLTELVKLLIQ
jgi:2-haloacid dehalogenase